MSDDKNPKRSWGEFFKMLAERASSFMGNWSSPKQYNQVTTLNPTETENVNKTRNQSNFVSRDSVVSPITITNFGTQSKTASQSKSAPENKKSTIGAMAASASAMASRMASTMRNFAGYGSTETRNKIPKSSEIQK